MELDFEQLYGYLEQTTRTKVFPFIIRNGYQNVSERGFEEKGTSSYFFSFFQKVFTGRETITATWEDSTQLNVRDASLGTYNYDFQVGKYFEGVIVPSSEMHNTEISNVSGNDSFLAMQTNGDINVLFFRNIEAQKDTDFIFDEDYLYKLYIMPETKFGNKWLYISNISTSVSPANPNLMIEVVTFSSLKDKLETSGRAIEQYVQYAAPGEPYAFPYVTYSGDVIVSPLRMNPEQIKYLQVELQGASALSSVCVFGRKIYWDEENEKWYTSPSKFLLPYRFVIPQTNELNKTSAPTKNFYCFPDETIETRSTTEWLEAIKKQSNELAPIQNMGSFTMSGNWTNGVHASNPLRKEGESDSGRHWDYNDPNWKPLSWISDNGITVTTSGNVYCSDTVKYTKNDSMIQILIKNAMANITQLELPLDMKQTRPYRWSTIKAIGFWTRWFGDRSIKQNVTDIRTNNICYFIDTNLATMQYNAFTQPSGSAAYGNLQMFNGENAPSMLNPQSGNSTICFELSDKVSFTDDKYNDNPDHPRPLANGIDTSYLSQTTDEYGVNLHNDGTCLLLNCEDNNLNVKYSNGGFVVDSVIVNALHVGKVKISCYGTEGQTLYGATYSPQFTQTVMSNSMFEEHNIRNWTTNITLGTWDENWSAGDISWPLEPQKKYNTFIPINIQGTNYRYSKGRNDLPICQPNNFYIDSTSVLKVLTRSETIYNQVIPYNQIDGSISTKEALYERYQKFAFDLTGTNMDFWLEYSKPEATKAVWTTAWDWKNICDGNQYIILDFNDIVDDKWSKTQGIFAMNNTDYNPIFPHTYSPDTMLSVRMEQASILSKWRGTNGGLSNYITISVEFFENELQIKVDSICKIIGYNWDAPKSYERLLGYTQGLFKEGLGRSTASRLNYQIKIPRLYTIPK